MQIWVSHFSFFHQNKSLLIAVHKQCNFWNNVINRKKKKSTELVLMMTFVARREEKLRAEFSLCLSFRRMGCKSQ